MYQLAILGVGKMGSAILNGIMKSCLYKKKDILLYVHSDEKLDYYMLKASDEESDVEDVLKLIKRLDELEPISLPWESDE